MSKMFRGRALSNPPSAPEPMSPRQRLGTRKVAPPDDQRSTLSTRGTNPIPPSIHHSPAPSSPANGLNMFNPFRRQINATLLVNRKKKLRKTRLVHANQMAMMNMNVNPGNKMKSQRFRTQHDMTFSEIEQVGTEVTLAGVQFEPEDEQPSIRNDMMTSRLNSIKSRRNDTVTTSTSDTDLSNSNNRKDLELNIASKLGTNAKPESGSMLSRSRRYSLFDDDFDRLVRESKHRRETTKHLNRDNKKVKPKASGTDIDSIKNLSANSNVNARASSNSRAIGSKTMIFPDAEDLLYASNKLHDDEENKEGSTQNRGDIKMTVIDKTLPRKPFVPHSHGRAQSYGNLKKDL